jgi:hypothetical protein
MVEEAVPADVRVGSRVVPVGTRIRNEDFSPPGSSLRFGRRSGEEAVGVATLVGGKKRATSRRERSQDRRAF